MKIMVLLLLIFCNTTIFSQDYDDSFIKYNLDTDLSQILINEGPPDAIIDERYVYTNKNINGFIVNYEYIFFDNKLAIAHIIFQIDKNGTIEYYNNIFYKIVEYYNKKYGGDNLMEVDYIKFINYRAFWKTDKIYIASDYEFEFIKLQMIIPKNNSINEFSLYLTYSHLGI
ncbi:hypothetical protein FACS189485_18760 [Spirochaetia bacterium]|nr:hypothetical protein FACS189485_18760 [Spirochaetia bacterium]